MGLFVKTAFYVLVCMMMSTSLWAEQKLTVYTEHYPPFNYLDDNQEVVGQATKNVRLVLDRAKIDYEIMLVPWNRAYVRARQQTNTLIYTVTRTPVREPEFYWLFPIAPSNFHVFIRSNDNRTVTYDAIKAGLFSGACVKDDLSCELLVEIGMPAENIRRVAKQVTGDYDMVAAGRADIYISELSVNSRLRELAGETPNLTKPVLPLNLKTGFYLAAGLNTDDAIRQRVMDAYEALVREGKYEVLDFSHTP